MSEEAKKAWINPRVPIELRVSAINRINNLIDRAEPMAVVETIRAEHKFYECPICDRRIVDIDTDRFCRQCGQALDVGVIAL